MIKLYIRKYILVCLFAFFCFFAPSSVLAEEIKDEEIFKGRVLEVLAEENKKTPEGAVFVQQNLKIIGLEGVYKDEEIEFIGIGDLEVLGAQVYETGDKVLVAATYNEQGEVNFYVVDSVRTGAIWLLAALFVFVILLIGRMKGLRSLFSLVITFLIILQFIIPEILSGANPLLITVIGSLMILAVIIYITEGFTLLSHLAFVSIFISLGITIVLSSLFVKLARLSGSGSEEVLFLYNIEGANLNLQGLLLAGIIIGTLGVLDDVIISQIATVKELSSEKLSKRELFKKAYKVGVSHIASMTNTLFLAYAGASLPLLILFVSGASVFSGWQQAINTELIATEIIRTLSGSIGLILSVPIATFLAAEWYSRKN